MRRNKRKRGFQGNGFDEWGGYMEAKKSKLQEQFMIDAAKEPSDNSKIFNGVAIFVNGYSVPSADELKLLMMKHGGIYHHYFRSEKTTHIIATNLPDTKVKQLKNLNVVKPDWIVDSIKAGKLLDYRNYLLYSNQSKSQPKLVFKNIESSKNTFDSNSALDNDGNTVNYSENLNDQTLQDCEVSNNSGSPVDFDSDLRIPSTGENTDESNVPSTSKSSSYSIKTASEAGFLSEFYSNSRLHHISTMGAMFKQYVNGLREKNCGHFPGVERLKMLNQNKITSSGSNSYSSVIMHIDMDCFFVSVGLRKRPDLKGFPVAVTHAKGRESAHPRAGADRKAEFELYKKRREEKVKDKTDSRADSGDIKPWSDWIEDIDESNSMSEIASCNYEARKLGLKNGMFLGQALKLCPNLKTISYDFEAYKEVSYCLYDTVASYTLDIEAVSCDEMFVDCTTVLNSSGLTPLELSSVIRKEIKEKTGCPCSAGFGANRLQARLATKHAKPDGQFYLEPSQVKQFMEKINVSDLPGVGRSTSYKLSSMGIKTCLDLQQVPLSKLQTEFGMKSGEALYKHCRGEDTKKLVFGQVRKSVSAEVNYGIRFHNAKEADTFLRELSKEVHNRLQEVNMKTKLITLKLMMRAADAPVETAKFLGHGVCDTVSRSSPLHIPTNDLYTITREVLGLIRQLNVDPTELRGIGIQLTRLENARSAKLIGNVMDKFLRPVNEVNNPFDEIKRKEKDTPSKIIQERKSDKTSSSTLDTFFTEKKHANNKKKNSSNNSKPLLPVDIDKDVLRALPEDIRKEVLLEYGLGSSMEKEDFLNISSISDPSSANDLNNHNSHVPDYRINYSQIDFEVLEELPAEIKKEIQSSLPREKNNTKAYQKKSELPSISEDVASTSEPKLDKNLSPTEVRTLIKAWTATEESPQQCDINMLAEYLQNLVYSRQLDSLDLCVSCLHRCIEKRTSSVWHEAYYTIINKLQPIMVAEYGLKLCVPKTFKT